jgi:hypothetical protein
LQVRRMVASKAHPFEATLSELQRDVTAIKP